MTTIAQKNGHKFYFSGSPCRRGHISRRYAQGHCIECRRSPERRAQKIAAEKRRRAKEPFIILLAEAYRRAKRKNLHFDLDLQWARLRWTGNCELSGLPFDVSPNKRGPQHYSPSIDRIVPYLGYTKDNCRFILMAINCFKAKATDEDLFIIVRAIAQRAGL